MLKLAPYVAVLFLVASIAAPSAANPVPYVVASLNLTIPTY